MTTPDPAAGTLRRTTLSVELAADTDLLEGVFPFGAGFVRIGDQTGNRLDVIVADLAAGEHLLKAVTAMVTRLRVQDENMRPALRSVSP